MAYEYKFYSLIVVFHKNRAFHFIKKGGKNNRHGSNNLHEKLRPLKFIPLLMFLHKVFKGKKMP